MSKLVRRFNFVDMWDYGKNESWYSDMALKGLHLQDIGNFLVTFEKGQPKKTKYRIEILEDNPSQEQLDLYKEYGWELVTNKKIFYVFSSPQEDNAPELHTDPMEQSFTFKMIDKQLKTNMTSISIIFLSFIASIFNQFFLQDQPYLFLIRQSSLNLMMLMVPYMYVFIKSISGYITVKKTKNALLMGMPLNHNKNWKLSYLFSSVFYILLIAMIIITLFTPYYTAVQRSLHTYKDVEDTSAISLINIETGPVYDYWHKLSYYWSFVSPVQYVITEDGYVDAQIQEELSGTYSHAFLHIRYYELTFGGMVEGLINDLIDLYYSEHQYEIPLIKKETDKFNQLYISDGETKLIFAGHDKKVIYIEYRGNSTAERIVLLLEEKYDL